MKKLFILIVVFISLISFTNIFVKANDSISINITTYNNIGNIESGYVIYEVDSNGEFIYNHKGEKVVKELIESTNVNFDTYDYIYLKANTSSNLEFMYFGIDYQDKINLEESNFYVFDKTKFTENVKITGYFASLDDCIVKVYDDSELSNIKNIMIVPKGTSITNLDIPNLYNHTFLKWSEDLSDVKNDINVYPIYTYNEQTNKGNKVIVNVYNNEGGTVEVGFAKYQIDANGNRIKDDNDKYIIEEKVSLGTEGQFKDGYFYIEAKPNPGYEFYGWTYETKGYLKLYKEELKVFSSRSLTMDYNFNAYFKTSNQHVVTYIQNTAVDSILGLEIVNHGEDAEGINAPKMSGKDFKSWNKEITNVQNDITVYPQYKYNIYTVFRDYWNLFLGGLLKTLMLSIIAVTLSLGFGAFICYLKLSKFKVLKFIGTTYVEVIRGVPLLLQLLLVYTIVPRGLHIGPLTVEVVAVILAMFLNSSAYIAEIYRSGIQAVNKGQLEAARALGMGTTVAMIRIVIPQAFKKILPSLGNELITVIKETSLASSVDAGIGELMSVKKSITSATYINVPPFIIIAIIYFMVTFSLSKGIKFIERKLANHD